MTLLHRIKRSLPVPRDNGDGFPGYVEQARKEGIDVNDWIEKNLHWKPALPVLEFLVFPFLRSDSVVCEVGVGTGRWSRHIVRQIPDGHLLLVDRSPWIVKFLGNYFGKDPRIKAMVGDGHRLPVLETEWADLIFSQGMFITLKLGEVMTYLDSFQKALKPSGILIFDFIDAETPGGWDFLRHEYQRAAQTFSYHTLGAIVECCEAAGLEPEGTAIVGKSTYLIVRKRL